MDMPALAARYGELAQRYPDGSDAERATIDGELDQIEDCLAATRPRHLADVAAIIAVSRALLAEEAAINAPVIDALLGNAMRALGA
jgi:hypothetical protein